MKLSHVHIIGIGGISMSGIAKILINRDINVSGSDLNINDQVKILKKMGAVIYKGHKKSNINNPDAVVYTNAINMNNPEIIEAKKRGIKIYKRAEFLSELFCNKKTIAITGTHGKTTTTSMLTSIFVNNNLDPSVMVGGNLDIINGNVKDGSGDFFITEADESDGSLTFFDPSYAIITNLEWDHFDYYKKKEKLIDKILEFIDKLSKKGTYIIYGPTLKEYNKLSKTGKKYLTYGLDYEDFTAKNIINKGFKSSFDLYFKDQKLGKINLNVPGEHNILNALAVCALCNVLNIDFNIIKNGLSKYIGVKRRFDKKGLYNNALIIDDYAHHPTEIINTLKTARKITKKKLYVVFQPHRYSRTENLMEEFSKSFDLADELILTDIYAASEEKVPGVSSKKLLEYIIKHKNNKNLFFKAQYMKDFKLIVNYLKNNIKPDDIVLTVGAGDVYKIGDKIIST